MPNSRVPVVPKGEKEPSSVNGTSGENSSYDSFEYDSYEDEYGDPKPKDIKKAKIAMMRTKLTKLHMALKKAVEDKEFLTAHVTEQEIKKLQAEIEKIEAQLETTTTTAPTTTTTALLSTSNAPTPTKTTVITQTPPANGFPGLQVKVFQIPWQTLSSSGFAINFPGMIVKY